MTPEQWEQVGKIFDAAVALPPRDRAPFLDQACKEDESLRREVESLLDLEGQAGGFLSAGAMEDVARVLAEEKPLLLIGKRLKHYELHALTAAGGMGEVYRARDVLLKREVAVKVLPSSFSQDAERLRRFKQEARAASALNHPNVVTIHEIGEVDSCHFIVSEYVDGETLRQRMVRSPLKLVEALGVAIQIASALEAAHLIGIVHRDIKPENIMVRPDGLVKVLDFGLAKLTEPQTGQANEAHATGSALETRSGMIMGTARYMSPEQARGLGVDSRTDIWSLGVVLYEMVTGRLPFVGETDSDVMVSILERAPASLSGDRREVPAELQRIVSKALRKDKGERYQVVKDLLLDLETLKQEIVQGVPTTTSKGYPIRKSLFWTAGVVSVLLIAVVVYYFVGPKSSPALPPLVAIPLTSDPGFEGMPSLSPDGNYVAFVAGGGEQQKDFDLYVKQIGGGPPLPLTTGPEVEFPAWSPDSQSIAFVRPKGEKLDVLLISPIGGPERKLAEIAADTSTYIFSWAPPFLSWSPDSKYLVTMDRLSAEEPYGLFIISVSSGEKRRLTMPPATALADGNPAISPDGHALAFVREESFGRPQLYVMRLGENYGGAGNAHRLELSRAWVISPAWTSDGRDIVCATSAVSWGETSLWRVQVLGSEKAQPLALGEHGSQPTISRQGNRLVYAYWIADFDIWRAEISGAGKNGQPEKLISSTQSDNQADYSADGSRIAFASDRSGYSEIWMCNSDGSSPVQLTSMKGTAGWPRWFPDGRRIVFDFQDENQSEIYEIEPDSRVPQRLTNGPQDNNTPSVSHDGKWIYFSSRRTGSAEIWRLPAEGGEATQLTHKGGILPIESADGSLIYYAKGGEEADVWKMSVSGGDETKVLGPTFAFAVVADGIYFIEIGARVYVGSRGNSLKFYRFATGSTEKVTDIKLNPNVGLSISPDRHYALMTLIDPEVCDLKLVENFR
jgi:serine/threonine protein kinase